jgi:tetratricopeptide (TPR) repeat protein
LTKKKLHIVSLVLGLFLSSLTYGQTLWEKPDSVQGIRIDSLYQDLFYLNPDSDPINCEKVLELAEAYLSSGMVFSADSLADNYLYRNYPDIPPFIESKLVQIRIRADSLKAWMNVPDHSQELISYLKSELSKKNHPPTIYRELNYELEQVYFLTRNYSEYKLGIRKAIELSGSLFLPDHLMDLAASYYYLDDLDSALITANEAFLLYEKIGDIIKLCYAHNQIGAIHGKMNDSKQSFYHYQLSFDLANRSSDIRSIEVAGYYLAKYYEDNGKPERAIPILRQIMAVQGSMPNYRSPFGEISPNIYLVEKAEGVISNLTKQRQLLFVLILTLILGGISLSLAIRLRAKKREAHLLQQINRIQINPHFIFNSLNSLQRFIIENDIGSSNKYLTRFSSLIRSVLNNTQENYIPVMDEIQFLEDYLALEKLRFRNQFSYELNVSQNIDIYNMLIPTMIIQPFIENSLWHGLIPKDGPGEIKIEWEATGLSCLNCTITDNGIGRSKAREIKGNSSKKNSSIGTRLIKNRLDQLSKINKSEYKFEYEDLTDTIGQSNGTKVIISIPLKWKKTEK